MEYSSNNTKNCSYNLINSRTIAKSVDIQETALYISVQIYYKFNTEIVSIIYTIEKMKVKFIQFCEDNSLFIVNICIRQYKCKLHTWTSLVTQYWNQIVGTTEIGKCNKDHQRNSRSSWRNRTGSAGVKWIIYGKLKKNSWRCDQRIHSQNKT